MRGKNLRFAASVAATILFTFSAAAAKTTAWIGGEDNLLSTAQNWNNGLPANGEGDTVIISNLSSSAISVCNDIEGLSCATITLAGETGLVLYGKPITVVTSFANTAPDSVVSNDVTLTSTSTSSTWSNRARLDLSARCDFYGKITHTAGHTVIYSREMSTGCNFYGEMDFSGMQVGCLPYKKTSLDLNAPISFYGPVKANLITGSYSTSGWGGEVHFYSVGNEISTVKAAYASYYLETTNAFASTSPMSFAKTANDNAAHFYLNGHDQTVSGMTEGGVGKKGCNAVYSSSPATLTLKATKSYSTYARINDEISVVYDPQGNYVQSFLDRQHLTSGSLIVKGGTLRMDGTNYFLNVPTIRVEPGATFDVATTNTGALPALKSLFLNGDARFAVAPTAVDLFGTKATIAMVDSSSRFVLPEGATLRVGQLYKDGHPVAAGSYSQVADATRNELALVEGAGTLVVDYAPSGTWWTGAKDSNWSDADNWTEGVPTTGVDAYIMKTGTVNVTISSTAAAAALRVLNIDGTTTLSIAADTALAGGVLEVGQNATVVVGGNALVTWDGTGVASSASEESVNIRDGGVVSIEGGTLHFTNTTGQVTLGGGKPDPSGTLRITAGTCTVYRTSGNGLSFLKRGLLKMTGGVFAFDHKPGVQDGGEIDCSGNAQVLVDYSTTSINPLFYTMKARFAGSSKLKWIRLYKQDGKTRYYTRVYWNPNAANETNLFEFVDSSSFDFGSGDYSSFGYGSGTTILRADTTGSIGIGNGGAVGANGGYGEFILSNGTARVNSYKFTIGGVLNGDLSNVYPTGYMHMVGGSLYMGKRSSKPATCEGIVLGECQLSGAKAAKQWPYGKLDLAGGVITNNSWLMLGNGGGRGEVRQSGGLFNMINTSRPLVAGQRGGTGIYDISGGSFTNSAGVYVGGCPTNLLDMYISTLRAGQPGYGTLNVSGGSFATEKDIFIGLDGHGAMNVGTGGVVYAKNLHLTNSYDQVLDEPTAASLTFTPGAESSGSIVLSGALEVSEAATISVDASAYKSRKRVNLVKCASITGKALSASDIELVQDSGKLALVVNQSGIVLVPQVGSVLVIR